MHKPKRKGNRGERTLVTIHGIWTDGPWQERFENVFAPHFHYESFKYPEFRNRVLAVLFLGAEWFGLFAALGGVTWMWRRGWMAADYRYWVAAPLLVVATVLVANLVGDWRRDQVATDFINFVDEANGSGLPPHVVAHSLGSFILGRLLLRFPEFKTGKVVLLGCVLKRAFGWVAIRQRFDLIRNELGFKDWVSSSAALLGLFIREMGAAGRGGFTTPPGGVVNFSGEEAGGFWKPCVCRLCRGEERSDVAVLNVAGQGIGHTVLTAITIRARRRWLPFFWDIPPGRFEAFVDLCLKCDEMEANGDPDLSAKIGDLLHGCWHWTRGPLEDFIANYYAKLKLPHLPPGDYVRDTAADLFRTIAEATRADDQAGQQFLFPVRALTFSVKRQL